MLTLVALLIIGPHLLLSDDIDLDGTKDKVYWTSHIHPGVALDELNGPAAQDIEIYVKSQGKMVLAGKFEESTGFSAFWVRQTKTNKRILTFTFIKNGIQYYMGLSRKFRLFFIDGELFA